MKLKLEEAEEKIEQAERDFGETRSEIEELKKERETSLVKVNRELTDARAIIKKTKGEVERLRRQNNDRENEWGEKLHGELNKRGELLRDEARKEEMRVEEEREEEREALRMRVSEKEAEAEALQAKLAEAAVLAEKAARTSRCAGCTRHLTKRWQTPR